MMYNYMTNGVCSRQIYLNIEDGIVKDVEFVGGCHGNLQGICAQEYGGENGTLTVDKPHTDLLTGETFCGEITLKPWQTLILQED